MKKPLELRQCPPRNVWFEARTPDGSTCGHRHNLWFAAVRCAQRHQAGLVASMDGVMVDVPPLATEETDSRTVIRRLARWMQEMTKRWDEEQAKRLEEPDPDECSNG